MNERRPCGADNSICVIIPAYNRCRELERALDSLVAQTDQDFDVVVCDDGSTEDITAVVHQYENRLRVQLIRIENSGGPARPRNIAMAAAKTNWVSFLDSDDWWLPHRMDRVKTALMDGNDIIYHQLTVSRADRNPISKPADGACLGEPLRSADPLIHMLRFGNPLPTSATTVRRTLMMEIGGFAEARDLSSVEDLDAWLRLASQGAQLTCIAEPLGFYWVGKDNISTFTSRQYERQKKMFERQLLLLPNNYRALAESNFNYLLGSYALDLGLPGASEHFHKILFRKEPIRWLKSRIKMWQRAWRRAESP